MSYSMVFTRNVSGPNGQVNTSVTVTGDRFAGFSGSIAAGAVDHQVYITSDFDTIQGIVITSDQPVNVYTNAIHSGAPDNTFHPTASAPLMWATGDYAACPVTVDIGINGVYIGNPGAVAANVMIAILNLNG